MSDEKDPRPPMLTDAQYWHYYRRYPYLLAKVALWAAVGFVGYWLVRNVEAVLFPVLVSLLTAYLLDPAVDWLEEICDRVPAFKRANASRTLAIAVFMTVIVAAIIGFVLILYPALATQVSKIIKRFPELITVVQTNLIPWIETTFDYQIPTDISEAMDEYGGTIREQLPSVAQRVSTWTGEILSRTGAVVASILNLVMIPLFSFYFLRDFDVFIEKARDFVPTNRRKFYLSRISLMDEVVGAWFRGQVTVALILAVLYSIGLAVTFGIAGVGVGTGIAIGVLAGVLNIIPYFGFLIGFVLSVLMVVLDWGGIGPLAAVVAVFAVVQGLEGWVITPKIVGDKVGLSPVMVIIVLLLGGELFGLLGVLLALPIAGIVRALMPDIVTHYKATPFFSGDYGADRAAANAARRSQHTIPIGLPEETDGHVDSSEELDVDSAVDPEKLKRPVTQEHASVGDRPESAPTPLDIGTDGDPEEDDEAEADERDSGEDQSKDERLDAEAAD